jgi:hypothetical protein
MCGAGQGIVIEMQAVESKMGRSATCAKRPNFRVVSLVNRVTLYC